jgi:hypothetical protein
MVHPFKNGRQKDGWLKIQKIRIHILPHIFLPAIHLLDGRERNLSVSDVGPMYGLERGVLQ